MLLVQFMAKNVLSFREETTFDLTAINAYKEHQCNLIDIGTKEKYLRVASIYGANASGKSNFVVAFRHFQQIIMRSMNSVDDGSDTVIDRYYIPFLFEKNPDNSEFQIIFIENGYEYRYGFEYNAECIVMEWLYRKNLKTNRKATVFERTAETVQFGASVRKECEVYKDQIPTETLALTFFNKLRALKTDIFKQVYTGIMNNRVALSFFNIDTEFLEEILPSVILYDKEHLIKFLTAIDVGIKDIDFDDSDRGIIFETIHKGRDGKDYHLNLYSESEGTIKCIMLYLYARAAIRNNGTLIFDELDIKLHTLLLKYIIDLFYDNNSSAQLIYTTHDTTLLDKRFFRRDQIWFVQKDEYGYSELSALSDFKVRSDASFEKDYLAGVYGGIPFLKEFQMREGE